MPSVKAPAQGHPLDEAIADKTMLAWFLPACRLLGKHGLLALIAAAAAFLLSRFDDTLPWPFIESWRVAVLHSFTSSLALTLVGVAVYRVLARKEGERCGVDDVNSVSQALVCGVQVCVVWTVATVVVGFALQWIGRVVLAQIQGPSGLLYGVLAVPIVAFLLAPLWMMLAVAGALSTAHAVRMPENGLRAVLVSLKLAFTQKWRVFWPSYAIAAAVVGGFLLIMFAPSGFRLGPPWIADAVGGALFAAGIAMTFVIERAYSPDLGTTYFDEEENTEPTPPSAGRAAIGHRGVSTPAGAVTRASGGGASEATGADLAGIIQQQLRSNRTLTLVELVERAVGADPRFFVGYPDDCVALAKRLVHLERPDLALRVLQPYVKEHRAHRLHLMGALLAGDLLGRDPARLGAAARFLSQLKTLYPHEPMVDQLLTQTEKRIAQLKTSSPAA